MSLLDRFERKFARFAIPNLTLFLVVGQSLFWLFLNAKPEFINQILFIPSRVLDGEVWRLFTFLLLPPSLNPLWAFFGLYFLYFTGTAMEAYWGTARYNLFLLVGFLATVAAAFLVPDAGATNAFITGSVFLAFAWLYPDFQILLFLILPIRIKWLALLAWLGYGAAILFGDRMTQVLALASIFNFLLFFGRSVVQRARSSNRQLAAKARAHAEADTPFHVCAVCGITDKTHPRMEFRYCPQCAGSPGYCADHIDNHVHRTAESPDQGR